MTYAWSSGKAPIPGPVNFIEKVGLLYRKCSVSGQLARYPRASDWTATADRRGGVAAASWMAPGVGGNGRGAVPKKEKPWWGITRVRVVREPLR